MTFARMLTGSDKSAEMFFDSCVRATARATESARERVRDGLAVLSGTPNGLSVLSRKPIAESCERAGISDPAVPASLKDRSVLGLGVLLAVAVVLLTTDAVAGHATLSAASAPLLLGILRVAALVGALAVITRTTDDSVVVGTMISATIFHTAGAVVLAHWEGHPEIALISAVTVSVGCAVLLPWSPSLQALLVASLLGNLAAGQFLLGGAPYPAILLIVAVSSMVVTIYLSLDLGATRRQLAARVRQDVEARTRAGRLQTDLEATVRERTASLEATREELIELCYAASHDLRPPLRAMAGFGEILREAARETGQSEHAQHLGRVIGFAEAMGTRLDELLQQTRTSNRKIADSLESLSDVARGEQAAVVEASHAPSHATSHAPWKSRGERPRLDSVRAAAVASRFQGLVGRSVQERA